MGELLALPEMPRRPEGREDVRKRVRTAVLMEDHLPTMLPELTAPTQAVTHWTFSLKQAVSIVYYIFLTVCV